MQIDICYDFSNDLSILSAPQSPTRNQFRQNMLREHRSQKINTVPISLRDEESTLEYEDTPIFVQNQEISQSHENLQRLLYRRAKLEKQRKEEEKRVRSTLEYRAGQEMKKEVVSQSRETMVKYSKANDYRCRKLALEQRNSKIKEKPLCDKAIGI